MSFQQILGFLLSGIVWAWIYVAESDKYLFVGFQSLHPMNHFVTSRRGKLCLILTLEMHAENFTLIEKGISGEKSHHR